MAEIWKPIPGFIGYEASTEGRIRKVTYGILKPQVSPTRTSDYPRVHIYNKRIGGTHQRRHMVHILVARAFIGECPEGMEHNHKDGNKLNARPDNIEFMTRSQNARHAYDVLGKQRQKGSKHGMAKLDDDKVRAIHAMRASGATLVAIRNVFGVSAATISEICHGRKWTHLGLEKLGDFRRKFHN